jgi:hypothetical protein
LNNVFFYCERTSYDILSEPLNFFTNLCFIIFSGLLLFDKSILDKKYALLIFLIGVGSLLFHSIPIRLTGFLDVFFIISFIYYYIFTLYIKLNIKKYLSAIVSIFFIIICLVFGIISKNTLLGSSAFYLPIIFHILFLYIYFLKKKKIYVNYNVLLFILVLFSLSLLLRSVDIYLCNTFFIGTHFIWHILNALVLYLLVKFYYLIPNRTSPKKPT